MTYTVPHFIQGNIVPGRSNHRQSLYNPATGEIIGQVALADNQEVATAIAAAKAAFPSWAATPAAQRTQILFKFNHLLHQHLDELAELITREHGKTLTDARGSVLRGIEVVEFACGAPNLLKGAFSDNVSKGIDTYSMRQPLGVCAGITPFNFPAMIALWMFPLAIACGNTFVLKPSEKDPSCSVRLAHLIHEAGLPDGVLNVVQGDQVAVETLLTHPDIAAVSFVGSTNVAEIVYKTAAAHGKRVQAMGGAKNHAVIMPDADLEQAADAIVGAAYGSAGERCMAISAVVAVGETTADNFINQLKTRVLNLKIGDGHSPEVEMGPLITAEHRERVKSYVDLGVSEGAHLVIDGRDYQHPTLKNGFYLGGCLFDHVAPHMRIYREEIFGPVLCVLRAPDLETALQWVNAHPFGNGTAIFTQSGHSAREFAARAQIGMVGINLPIPVPSASHSFGGWKLSFFGDTGMYGTEAIHFYTRLKKVLERWPTAVKAGMDFNIPTART